MLLKAIKIRLIPKNKNFKNLRKRTMNGQIFEIYGILCNCNNKVCKFLKMFKFPRY